MKTLLLAAAAAVALSGAAYAADAGVVAGYFGNTQVFTPDGASAPNAWLWYNADGTYSEFRGGNEAKGKWRVADDGSVCVQRTDTENAKEFCHPFAARKVGDAWDETNPRGTTHMKLVAGHVNS